MNCGRVSIKMLVLLLLGGLLTFITYSAQMGLSEFKLRSDSGIEEIVKLPLLRGGIGEQRYTFSGVLQKRLFSQTSYRVTPDNDILSIKVNDKPMDLSSYSPESLGDFRNGLIIDFSGVLKLGDNTVEIALVDHGGDMGLSIKTEWSWFDWVLLASWAVFLLVVLNQVWQTQNLPYSRRMLYFLIILGCALRISTIAAYNPVAHIWSDAERHWSQGTDALRIDLMSQTDPIVYQLYVGALAKLTLKIPELVAFYTICLSLLTPWLWYRFLRELQPNKNVALAGWAILGLTPSWISIYSYFMQETLLLPLLGAALWASFRAKRKSTTSAFLVMVLIWIVAGLTRGIAIPLAAVCCIYLWLNQEEKIRRAAYSIIVLTVTLGPLAYRNYQAVGLLAPHGLGHVASLYALSGKREIILNTERRGAVWTHGFWSPSFGAKPFEPFSDWTSQRTGRFSVDVDFDKGKEDWNTAYERLSGSLVKNPWIIGENLIFIFFSSSWPDNNPDRLLDRINVGMRWAWFPLSMLVVVGVLVFRRRLRGQWLLPLLLLAWFVVQGLMPIAVNEGRYRKPFEGLLICQCLLLFVAARGKRGVAETHEQGGMTNPQAGSTKG